MGKASLQIYEVNCQFYIKYLSNALPAYQGKFEGTELIRGSELELTRNLGTVVFLSD